MSNFIDNERKMTKRRNQRDAELQNLALRLGLTNCDPKQISLIDEALTHISAGYQYNYEQLEFLGDAVLRLAATVYINQNHKGLKVGECSTLRATLVSDQWLADVGESLDLFHLLQLGTSAQNDPAAKQRLLSDCTEALIGALYAASGDIEVVLQWLTIHWHDTAAKVLKAPHRFNGKTALQEWSQGQGLGLPYYSTEECSHQHGDPERFRCQVSIQGQELAEAKGRSRKEAEQNAASAALQALEGSDAPQASQ